MAERKLSELPAAAPANLHDATLVPIVDLLEVAAVDQNRKATLAQVKTYIGAAGIPVGGSAGQMLTKASGVDHDVIWATADAIVHERVAGGAGFVNVTGAVTLDLALGRVFQHIATGNLTGPTFTNVPAHAQYSAEWRWVLKIDAVGGYTLTDTPPVTFVDGASFADADMSANAVNTFVFWRDGTTTFGSLVTNGSLTLDPFVLSFPTNQAHLLPITRRQTLGLDDVTNVEADGTAGTGTLSFKKDDGAIPAQETEFLAGEVLTVTLAGASTPSGVAIPRIVYALPPLAQSWGVTALTVETADPLLGTDFRLGRRFTVGATSLNMNRLRVYAAVAGTFRVIVHRQSDGVTMATTDIVVAGGEVDAWKEAAVASAVLVAGADYVVSARSLAGGVNIYRNPTLLTYDAAAHTHVGYRYAGPVDTLPGSTLASAYFWADFGWLA
jgi:hypothetical protein